ncbi:hypothetical protein [Corallococcus caeni]|uniref:DUF5602 domain-containing protein n=1 Tax=Corallococcus caeni TaxID=3082388 RepID=A0ABQ6QQ97_9BACT|nr:DUF5602 domain-containing protein [Corallococcus sp. NO1]
MFHRLSTWILGVALLGMAGCSDDGETVDACVDGKAKKVSEKELSKLLKDGAYRGMCDLMENRVSFGDGYVQSIVQKNPDGSVKAIGVTVDQAAMDTLPMLPNLPTNDGQTCWDTNNDGVTDPEKECNGGHERVLWFPKMKDVPFQWIMFNWQGRGHGPIGAFDKGHFDLHFFMQDFVKRNFIRTGPCGVYTDCNDYAKAIKDPPAPFYPTGFENQKGVSARMGNHLADIAESPFNGEPFTQAFVYGAYDGHITYFETVVEGGFAKSKPAEDCRVIKAPPAMEVSGLYPTRYCFRYREDRGDYLMTLEDFEYRTAPN